MTTTMNSTDASRGQPLKVRAQQRVRELKSVAAKLEPSDHNRRDIEEALFRVEDLLAGDDEHLPSPVAAEVNRWLEANKHLAERHPDVSPARELGLPPPRSAAVRLVRSSGDDEGAKRAE
jgi:hypothetical protein